MGQWDYAMSASELVYVDSFNGLVPAKILGTFTEGGSRFVVVKVTASRPAWRKNEIAVQPESTVVHRKAVSLRNHKYRITNYAYTWDQVPVVDRDGRPVK